MSNQKPDDKEEEEEKYFFYMSGICRSPLKKKKSEFNKVHLPKKWVELHQHHGCHERYKYIDYNNFIVHLASLSFVNPPFYSPEIKLIKPAFIPPFSLTKIAISPKPEGGKNLFPSLSYSLLFF